MSGVASVILVAAGWGDGDDRGLCFSLSSRLALLVKVMATVLQSENLQERTKSLQALEF